jgi:hypothetical protein
VAYYRHDYAQAATLCRGGLTLHRKTSDDGQSNATSRCWAARRSDRNSLSGLPLFKAVAALRDRFGGPLPPVQEGNRQFHRRRSLSWSHSMDYSPHGSGL